MRMEIVSPPVRYIVWTHASELGIFGRQQRRIVSSLQINQVHGSLRYRPSTVLRALFLNEHLWPAPVFLILFILILFAAINSRVAIAGPQNENWQEKIEHTIAKAGPTLTTGEKQRLAQCALEGLKHSGDSYSTDDLNGFLEGLALSVAHWAVDLQGADARVRSLLLEQHLLELESALDTFHMLLPMKRSGQFDHIDYHPPLDIFRTALDRWFADAPPVTRKRAVERVRSAWNDARRNLFTGAGKRNLTDSEMLRLQNTLDVKGKESSSQLAAHRAESLPDDAKVLPPLYLNKMVRVMQRSLLTNTGFILPISQQQGAAAKSRAERLIAIQRRISHVQDVIYAETVHRLEQDLKKYPGRRLVEDYGKQTMDEAIVTSVTNMAGETAPINSAVKHNSKSAVTHSENATYRTPVTSRVGQQGDRHAMHTWSRWYKVLIVVGGVAAVLWLVWKRRRLHHAARVTRGSLMSFTILSVMSGGAINSQSVAGDTLSYTMPDEMGVTSIEGMSLYFGRLLNEAADARPVPDIFAYLIPQLREDLRTVLNDKVAAPAEKRAQISALLDIALIARQSHEKWRSQDEYQAMVTAALYQLRPRLQGLHISDELWKVSVDKLVHQDLTGDRYWPVYAHMWSQEVLARIRAKWLLYLSRNSNRLLEGICYARKVAVDPSVVDAQSVSDAFVRRAITFIETETGEVLVSPRTRYLIEAATLLRAGKGSG